MRGLAFSIRSTVFRASHKGASFKSIVSASKEVELIEREDFGDVKRTVHPISFLALHLEVEDPVEGVVPSSIGDLFMRLS